MSVWEFVISLACRWLCNKFQTEFDFREQQEMLASDLAKNSESFSPVGHHVSSDEDHHGSHLETDSPTVTFKVSNMFLSLSTFYVLNF